MIGPHESAGLLLVCEFSPTHGVTPAKAGVQPEVDARITSGGAYLRMDSGLRRNDPVRVATLC